MMSIQGYSRVATCHACISSRSKSEVCHTEVLVKQTNFVFRSPTAVDRSTAQRSSQRGAVQCSAVQCSVRYAADGSVLYQSLLVADSWSLVAARVRTRVR